MRAFFNRLKLQTKIVLLTCLVFTLAITAENLNIIKIVNDEFYTNAVHRAENVASQVVVSPIVLETLLNPTQQNIDLLQAHTAMLSKVAQVEFIVIFDMDGLRKSHPHPEKIGKSVEGSDTSGVLEGKSYISTAKGTLGASLRALKPVYSAENKQIGAVIVGIMSETIDLKASKTNKPIITSLLFVLALGIVLAILLSKSIKNILYGLEPAEIAKIFEERDAIFRTVREGIIAINKDGDVTLINDEARRILKVPVEDETGYLTSQKHKVHEYIPNTRLGEVMRTGESEYDREQKINDAVILTSRTPLKVKGEIVGAIATFRDMTEIRQLAENLTGVNRYVDALRSQSHEFFNKLHVIYGLVHSNHREELLEYLKKIIGKQQEEEEIIHHSIKDPIVAGFLASKFSRARELGIFLSFNIKGTLAPIKDSKVTHSLVTILGNLIDNALDAVQDVERKNIDICLSIDTESLVIEVNDSGIGLKQQSIPDIFAKGYSTKGENRGFGLYLVYATVDELNGQIEIDSEPDMGLSFMVSLPIDSLYKEVV